MPISLPCTCGKTLSLKDDLAGRRIKCPACGGVLTVPAAPAEEVESGPDEEPEESAEEPEDRPKKKKKKSKKKGTLALTKKQKKEKEFERETERREMIRRLIEGIAYVVLGLVATIGSIYALMTFWGAMLEAPHYGLAIIIGLGVGLAAIAKGVFLLISVRFTRDDEDDD